MTQKQIFKGNPVCEKCGSNWLVAEIDLGDGRIIQNIWCRKCDTLEEKQ